MRKRILFVFCSAFLIFSFSFAGVAETVCAAGTTKNYYTIYESSTGKVLFLKGDEVLSGDMYLSHDNKLYEIQSVDENQKTAFAKFLRDEKLPEYKVKAKSNNVAKAASKKVVGVYHTHNDECYFTPDGVDSVYGKGGIHDVGKAFVENLNKLNINALYREDLHLPHNSGAYTRSQVTAKALLDDGAQAIFDLHRDSTKRSEYLTKVNGEEMSSVRMVVGASSANFEENQKFAYSIKSYADSVYPGLVKDIYIGKGNYNQQLTTKAMLFEMGCENIEKDYAIKTTSYLAKVVDVVLYGTDEASDVSLNDVESASGDLATFSITGLNENPDSVSVNSNDTLWVVLSVVGVVGLNFSLIMIFSKTARFKVGRFFSEMFAGVFGKRKTR